MYTLGQQGSAIELLYNLAKKQNRELVYSTHINTADSYLAELGYVKRKDTGIVRTLLSDSSFVKLAPADAVFLFGNSASYSKEKFVSIYAIKTNGLTSSALNESDVKSAMPNFSNPHITEINVKLTHRGSRIFEELTRQNVGRPIALTVNNFVISAPRVTAPIFEGDVSISGDFTPAEANMLALQLRSKPLPFPITLIHHEILELKQPLYKRFMTHLIFLLSFIILAILIYHLYPALSSENKSF
jgi:SecD/SecF fusion protein